MNDTWRAAWRERGLLVELALTVPVFAAVLFALSRFLLWVETRPGVVLPDPILSAIPPRDVDVIIFALIYGSIVLCAVTLARHPRALLLTLQAYTIMIIVRMGVMAVTPLEPPPDMIPLVDPLASIGTGGYIPAKDLFFSGHTSTIFLLFLTARRGFARWIFLGCAAAVGTLVLVQHCHYTIDVVAAPFFAHAAWRIALRLPWNAVERPTQGAPPNRQ